MKTVILSTLTTLFLISSTLFAQTSLTIAGTGDSQVLLRQLGEEFKKTHSEFTVQVPDSIGSGGGIKALIKGKVDLARTARALEAKEKSGLVEVLFAKSPIVFVVHSSVTEVTNLTTEQMADIYNGKYRNWRELGGPDHKIYAIDRETDDSSRSILTRVFSTFTPVDSVVTISYTTLEAVEMLTKNPFTIGYLPLSIAKSAHLKVLTLNGITPTDSTYPLITPFYLVYKEPMSDLVKQFIDFVSTPPAQHIMEEIGVITVDN